MATLRNVMLDRAAVDFIVRALNEIRRQAVVNAASTPRCLVAARAGAEEDRDLAGQYAAMLEEAQSVVVQIPEAP